MACFEDGKNIRTSEIFKENRRNIREVLKFSKIYLEDAPEVFKGNEQDNYIDKIAKLNDGKRIILILNLPTLLSFM